MKDSELEKLKVAHAELEERLIRLEQVVFDAKVSSAITLNQQILMLEQLGALEPIFALKISNVKRAELVAILLGRDMSNVKKALEDLTLNQGKNLRTQKNLHFLLNVFSKGNLADKYPDVISDLMFHLKPEGKEPTDVDDYLK